MGMFDTDDNFEYIVHDIEISRKKLAELIRVAQAYTVSPEGMADYLVSRGVRVLANHKSR